MEQKILVSHAALGKILRAITGPEHWIRELQFTRSIDQVMPNAEERNPINLLIEQFNDPANVVRPEQLEVLSTSADQAEQLQEAQRLLQETYQIAGELLTRTGEFDSERGQNLLDNLSAMSVKHEDLLPWTYEDTQAPTQSISELPAAGELAVTPEINATGAASSQWQQRQPATYQALELPQIFPTGDPKYVILNNQLCNAATYQPIPADEGTFIFRFKDIELVPQLEFYASRVKDPSHRQAVLGRLREAVTFAQQQPWRMKDPDTVLPPHAQP